MNPLYRKKKQYIVKEKEAPDRINNIYNCRNCQKVTPDETHMSFDNLPILGRCENRKHAFMLNAKMCDDGVLIEIPE